MERVVGARDSVKPPVAAAACTVSVKDAVLSDWPLAFARMVSVEVPVAADAAAVTFTVADVELDVSCEGVTVAVTPAGSPSTVRSTAPEKLPVRAMEIAKLDVEPAVIEPELAGRVIVRDPASTTTSVPPPPHPPSVAASRASVVPRSVRRRTWAKRFSIR